MCWSIIFDYLLRKKDFPNLQIGRGEKISIVYLQAVLHLQHWALLSFHFNIYSSSIPYLHYCSFTVIALVS
uniref:Uncharacterized protein n=1 Tax=Tetranychus urticae TaxID=32264 RepID=T1KMI8_TETUR